MNTPPLLLGVTLIFWGYEAGFLAVGVVLGGLLESTRWLKRKWELTPEEFNQLWNITVLLFLGAGAFVFASSDGMGTVGSFVGAQSFTDRSHALDRAAETVFVFLRWLPMVFFPFTMAQACSQRERIDFRTFSWFLRRQARKGKLIPTPGRGVNAAYPFFSICLISASTVNTGERLFFIGLIVLIGWAMWPVRSPRFGRLTWATALTVSVVAGYFGATSLRDLQQLVDALHTELISGVGGVGRDPKEARTAIGQLGRMKGSGRVVLRVEIPRGSRMTHVLREASYNLYRWPDWRAVGARRAFQQMFPEQTESSWFYAATRPDNAIRVSAFLPGGQGMLALPHGVVSLEELPVIDLRTNHLGAALVEVGPGLVTFTARSGVGTPADGPPDQEYDLQVPAAEREAVRRVVKELRLTEVSAGERPRVLERFFARNFSYSLYQDSSVMETNAEVRTPLAHFLLKRRAGHCEYFATATTLLLREAGIPARYALGYSIQEHVGNGHYVVRARHAHAWCLYYDHEAKLWRELDTTPGTWVAMEAEQRPLLEPLTDAFSWVWFQFSRWRWGQGNLRQYLFFVLAGALALLVVRFFLQKRRNRSRRVPVDAAPAPALPGLDSEFYRIERALAGRGLGRRPSEPLYNWLGRVGEHLPMDAATLREVIDLHCRLRFDPKGLGREEREVLRERAMAVWERMANSR